VVKSDLTYEQLERRRRNVRWIVLSIAVLLTVAGCAVLAVPPETSMDRAIPRAFVGMALLVAGFFVALLSRLVP
jgi:uncharacterized membrane protein HdeD (DUF308 family)